MSNSKTMEDTKKHFDPDFSPHHEINQEAAKDHGLKYDSKNKVYKDEDGCLIRDRFGQRL
jgi:hypothetical protein